MFSYSITTHFIPGNKDYHSCCNPHLVYQTYSYSHPWGLWACHKPLTFLVYITLGLQRPFLTFIHHILPMGMLFLFPDFFKPACLFKAHLLISWACDPLFLPLGPNGFVICLPILCCPCRWAFLFSTWTLTNDPQHFFNEKD